MAKRDPNDAGVKREFVEIEKRQKREVSAWGEGGAEKLCRCVVGVGVGRELWRKRVARRRNDETM